MRRVMWASVRIYARRYVATVVAIVIGVGFVVATDGLASATRSALLADAAQQYAGSRAVVSDIPDVATARRVLARSPGTAAVNAQTTQPLALDGRTLTDQGQVGTVATAPSLRWQSLVRGRFPAAPGEALADANAAADNHVHLGDRVTVGRGADATTVTVTGFAGASSGQLSAPLYLTWQDLAARPQSTFVTDLVTTSGDVAAVRAAVPPQVKVQTTSGYLQDAQAELTRGVDVLAAVLLVFAAIAFFVSALVIANTFSVLLAQRVRDFALLRCVGATRRQIRRSVLAEALVVGVSSSTAGVLLGWGLAVALTTVGAALFPAFPLGTVRLSVLWVVGAWLLGVLVTTAASLVPAVRGTRVSPLAALRPDDAVDVRSSAGRTRIAVALVLLAGGTMLLKESVTAHSLPVMIAGGAVSFVGVLAFGPVLVPACIRVLGLLTGRFGVPGRLAAANALRNPRRTSATAASLLVGVTLVAGLVVGMATVRASIDTELDVQYPLDVTLTATRGPLQPDAVQRVRAVDGVASAVGLPGASATLLPRGAEPVTLPVLAMSPQTAAVLRSRTAFAQPVRNTVYLPWEVLDTGQLADGKQVVVRVGGRERRLTMRGADGIGQSGVVSAATLRELAGGAATSTQAVWARAAADADASKVRSAVTTIGWSSHADASGGLEGRAFVNLQLDVMTRAVIALLGIGIVIALVGIGNSLGLSVLERQREHAVLRALGLTRRQLAGTLATEAVLLATVAGLLGSVLGAAYAWVAVQAVVGEVLDDVSVVLPLGELVLLVLAATAAGLVACVLPARRAARVAPAQGLTAD